MKKRWLALVAACLGNVILPAVAATETAVTDRAPIDHFDFDSKQRGASLYVNYCLGCHSLKYMRYTRIGEDLGIADDVLTANIAFGGG